MSEGREGREFNEGHDKVCSSCPSSSRGLPRADTSHPFFAVNIYMYSQCSSGIKAKRVSLPCGQAPAGSRLSENLTSGPGDNASVFCTPCLHACPSPHTCSSAVSSTDLEKSLHAHAAWCECAGSHLSLRAGAALGGGWGSGIGQAGWGDSLLLIWGVDHLGCICGLTQRGEICRAAGVWLWCRVGDQVSDGWFGDQTWRKDLRAGGEFGVMLQSQ